jgi:uncharacterized protein (TIGR00297 family)
MGYNIEGETSLTGRCSLLRGNDSIPGMPLLLGFSVSLLVALAGYTARALTRAGALTATLVGTLIIWRTGGGGLAALGAFFVGSSLISRLAPDPGSSLLDAKGATRDPMQVLANGGAAALAALLAGSNQAALWSITGSLAAAAADTWATSSGAWSRTEPRHILTGRRVPAGTSGGITVVGSVGAAAGAASVGLAAMLCGGGSQLLPLALVVGMLGMLLDSAAGALLQGKFRCDQCQRDTERRVHRCGAAARHLRGLAWLTNDGVNAIATITAALLGYAAFLFYGAGHISDR